MCSSGGGSGTRQLVELVLGRQSGTSAMHAFMIFVLRKNGYFHAAQRIEVIWNWDTECCETTSEGISRRKIVMCNPRVNVCIFASLTS